MSALKDVSKVWLVAKMVHTLFESILGNKVLEERLQKAAGKRHQKPRPEAQDQAQGNAKKPEPPKRKFDDMDLGVPNGGPTPPVSYERSRPQTPAATPSRELGQNPLNAQVSPNPPRETLPGVSASRGNTRPTTPFNGQYSLPATPPDLFLVTRTSPNLSPSLWENFQPEQLFPDGTNIFPDLSSPQSQAVDPQLQMQSQYQNMQRPMMMNQGQPMSAGAGGTGAQGSPPMMSGMPAGMGMQTGSQQQQQQQMFGMGNQQPWMGLQPMGGGPMDSTSQDDNWSNSSRSGPTAPTTLNVEDW